MPTKTAACRNCGASEIYTRDLRLVGDSSHMLPVGFFFNFAEMQARVCGECGLIEWFAKSETLERVKKKFQRED